MEKARSESAEAHAPGDRHRNRAARERAVAKLTILVVAPAVRGARVGECTGMPAQARGEGREGQARGDRDRDGAADGRAGPELTKVIPAPAVGLARAREPAGVIGSAAEGAEGQAAGDQNGNRAVAKRPVPEFAVVVATPTVGPPVAGQSASVIGPRDQRRVTAVPEDRHRRQATPREAVAELTDVVRAPTVGRAVSRQPTGVSVSRGDDCEDKGGR